MAVALAEAGQRHRTTVSDRRRLVPGIYDTPKTYTTDLPTVQTVDQLPRHVQEAISYLPPGADAQDAWNLKVALMNDPTPLHYEQPERVTLKTRIKRFAEDVATTVFYERSLRKQRAYEARVVFEGVTTGRNVKSVKEDRQLQSDIYYLQTGIRKKF